MQRTYGSTKEADALRQFAPIIEKAIKRTTGNEVVELWMDIGMETYDLHVEIYDDKKECTDLYFEIVNNDLKERYFGEGSLSNLIGEDEVQKMLLNINSYKEKKLAS